MSTSSATTEPQPGTNGMSPAGASADPERCPQCAARRSAEAQWCTQCYHRFEQAAPVEPAVPEPAATTSWDERHRQAAESIDEEQRAARTEEVMAQLETATVAASQNGGLVAFAGTALGKAALIGGGTALLLGFGLLVMWAAGQFL